MLKLYHAPLSNNSRRVWMALLEKALPFELVALNLDGDQHQPDFLALNPFHHIPVLVDNGFRVLESLAILDYLEAKYPHPSLLPTDAEALAKVRMVEMVTVNELAPAFIPLMRQMMDIPGTDPQQSEQAKQRCATVLNFFENLFSSTSPYFVGEQLTVADIVAGTTIHWLPRLGMALSDYPQLAAWRKRLQERPSWQATQPSPEAIEAFTTRLKALLSKQ